jgi:glycosyltransferase involved in cell wall biosynthesis
VKHVWVLNHYALEPGGAGGTRHFNLSKHLRKYGWRATVLAASVELNSGRQRLSDNESTRLEQYEGIPFLWVRTPQYQGNGSGRMLNMLAYTFRVLLPGCTKALDKPEVIIGSSVHPFAAFAGRLLAWRHRVPFIFEVRDLWPQTLIDLGRIKERSFLAFVLRRLEKWLYQQASSIIVLLPKATDYIMPLGIAKEKIVWIPNGVDFSSFPAYALQNKKEGEPFVLMYFGAHGQANALKNVILAMGIVEKKSQKKKIVLRLIGDGPLKKQLLDLVDNLGLKNVSFSPPVPKNTIPELASEADAFVFNLLDAPVFRFGISSNKLFDFMAAARPILFCSDAVNNPVKDARAGVTVPPGNPEELARAIIGLAETPFEERKKMGEGGRRYVEEQHDFDVLARRLSLTMEQVIDQ